MDSVAGICEWKRRMNAEETNKNVVRAYVDAFNRGDVPALKALFAPEAEIQGVLGAGHLEKVAAVWAQLISGLGLQLTLEALVAEGDCVAARYTERGVFKGPFLGQAPTGKSYTLVAMEWFVIREGRIQRRWGARDFASQARQIGLALQ